MFRKNSNGIYLGSKVGARLSKKVKEETGTPVSTGTILRGSTVLTLAVAV